MTDTRTPGQPSCQNSSPKAALITGAGARLGRNIALAMAADGWDIAIHYRKSKDPAHALQNEIQAMGRQAICVAADLDCADEVTSAFAQCLARLPHLRCVVNNASRFEFDRPENVQATALQAHFAANVVAPVLLTQLLHAALAPRHQAGQDPTGVVIHLLDQKLVNPNPDFYSYTLSKAALLEATRLSAMAFAPVLRVVGLGPGITLPSADQTDTEFAKTHTMTPLGASSRPQDVSQAVVWLAQARAVTGTMLLVDGGQHLTPQPRDVMMMIR
jgi:NAD(P)-dependent dehydrogenase (short-subunit alcohol dehydrogenase family)